MKRRNFIGLIGTGIASLFIPRVLTSRSLPGRNGKTFNVIFERQSTFSPLFYDAIKTDYIISCTSLINDRSGEMFLCLGKDSKTGEKIFTSWPLPTKDHNFQWRTFNQYTIPKGIYTLMGHVNKVTMIKARRGGSSFGIQFASNSNM